MASTNFILPKQKILVCQLGNQEKCMDADSVFNIDSKVIIKDIANKTTKKIWEEKNAYSDDTNYEYSTDSCDEGEKGYASSGRNSPMLPSIKNFSETDRDGEEAGASSGYESEQANQNRHARRKRKLSKRKELLSAAFVASHADVKVHRPSAKRAMITENIQQIEASDNTETDSTLTDESVLSEDSSTDSEERNSESGQQPRNDKFQQKNIKNDSLPQNIISNFPDVPVAECRDQQVSFSGNYKLYHHNERFLSCKKK